MCVLMVKVVSLSLFYRKGRAQGFGTSLVSTRVPGSAWPRLVWKECPGRGSREAASQFLELADLSGDSQTSCLCLKTVGSVSRDHVGIH